MLVALAYGFFYSLAGTVGLGWNSGLSGVSATFGNMLAGFFGMWRVAYLMSESDPEYPSRHFWWLYGLGGCVFAFLGGMQGIRKGILKGYTMSQQNPPPLSFLAPWNEFRELYSDISRGLSFNHSR